MTTSLGILDGPVSPASHFSAGWVSGALFGGLQNPVLSTVLESRDLEVRV